MRIAILGASGQLGKKTLDALLVRGTPPSDIVAAVRTPEKLHTYKTRGVEVRRADYDDAPSLRAAFEGVTRLLLVPSTAPSSLRVQQYERAVTAAKDAGVRHLVHYGLVPTRLDARFIVTPFLLYAESLLRISGLDWTILRNSLYADPIADWIPNIVKMGTIPYPTGEGRCAYVRREDAARAGAAVMTTDGHAGQIYHLTSPRAVTTSELCDIVHQVTGQPVVARPVTDADYAQICRDEGESEFMIEALLSLYHTVRDGHLNVASDDIQKLTGQPAEDLASYFGRTYLA